MKFTSADKSHNMNESEFQRLSSSYIEMGPVVNESFT